MPNPISNIPIQNDDTEFPWITISYPPSFSKFHDGPVLSFLGNLDVQNPIQHIINHFHSSINEKQIRHVIKYFSDVEVPWHGDSYKYSDPSTPHFQVIQKDLTLKFGKIDKVFFGIAMDEFFNEFRICWVRIINQQWKVKKTIFVSDDKKNDWKRIQRIF